LDAKVEENKFFEDLEVAWVTQIAGNLRKVTGVTRYGEDRRRKNLFLL